MKKSDQLLVFYYWLSRLIKVLNAGYHIILNLTLLVTKTSLKWWPAAFTTFPFHKTVTKSELPKSSPQVV